MEVALAIFSVLDHDNSGHVSTSQLKPWATEPVPRIPPNPCPYPNQVKTSELKATLLGMDAGLMPEDIDETMLLFDNNRHAPRGGRGGCATGGREICTVRRRMLFHSLCITTLSAFTALRSGDITKHEFVQTLELLNTFA